MRYIQAVLSLALFGWFCYMLLTNSLDLDPGGSSKTRLLKDTISGAVNALGTENAGYLCIATGILLAAYFVLTTSE